MALQTSKIALIGTGAAALGAMAALRSVDRGGCTLDIFEIDQEKELSPLESVDHRQWTADDYDSIHHDIRQLSGRKFPPPVSYFGTTPPTTRVGSKRAVLRSVEPGGLTKYWSASMLPFTDADLAGWNISRAELDPYYSKISEFVGIAGRDESFDEYFGEGFVTRPAIEASELSLKLVDAVNQNGRGTDFQLYAGINRLAVETRPGNPRSCVNCGGCYYGCFRGSIFNAADKLTEIKGDLSFRRIRGKVSHIRPAANGKATVISDEQAFTGYDKVFCAAGCIGTAELMLRSLGNKQTTVDFVDNDLFFFPMFCLGKRQVSDLSTYVAISNAVVGYLPASTTDKYAEVHVAPVADWLLRYYLPGRMWPLVRWLAHTLRARVLLGSLFMHSDTSPRLQASLGPRQEVTFRQIREGTSRAYARKVVANIAAALRNSGIILPAFPMVSASTSVHYAGGFQPGAGDISANSTGEIVPNVHLIDSSIFPASPAQPLTFSIMANAARIVTEVMSD